MNAKISRLALVATIFGLTVSANAAVINPKQSIDGVSQLSLSQQWWQWSAGQPAATNPISDNTGAFANQNNDGSVFFLAGAFGGTVERNIDLPYGKTIFFPVLNAFYITTPKLGEACLIGGTLSVSCALDAIKPYTDGVSNIFATLDGRNILNFSNIRQTSKDFFDLTLPEGNIFGIPADTYASVSDGYWLGLKNLPKGEHTLEFGGTFGDGSQLKVIDHLNVGMAPAVRIMSNSVPEPATWLLAIPALVALARKRKADHPTVARQGNRRYLSRAVAWHKLSFTRIYA